MNNHGNGKNEHNHSMHSEHNHTEQEEQKHHSHQHPEHGHESMHGHHEHGHEEHKNHDHSHDHSNQHHEHSGHHGHGGHGGHHEHHEHMVEDFKKRFWISLVLSIPILYLSPMIQMLIGYEVNFTGDTFLLFLLSTIVFFYGGKPFLLGAWDELKEKSPAMMMLISLAIIAAYVYSTLTAFFIEGSDFFFELATLIVIMLLGHWIEMKSLMGASKALEELIKCKRQTAHTY